MFCFKRRVRRTPSVMLADLTDERITLRRRLAKQNRRDANRGKRTARSRRFCAHFSSQIGHELTAWNLKEEAWCVRDSNAQRYG